MPIEIELPDGSIGEFPDTMSMDAIKAVLRKKFPPPGSLEAETKRITQERATKAAVPMSGSQGWLTPEQEALTILDKRTRDKAEREAYEARTPTDRLRDTAAFLASAPVRAVSRGEYGAGDVAQAAGLENIARALSEGERGFAWANEPGLKAAAALGEVTAGIPMLNSMGAVTGGMTRSVAGNLAHPLRGARHGVGEVVSAYGEVMPSSRDVGHFLRSERGAVPLPGEGGPRIPSGASGAGEPPLPPQQPPASVGSPYGPTRNEIIAAGERINQRLPEGEGFQVPVMVAGNAMERGLAGGLAAIPYAGSPVVNAWDRGLFGLGRARDAATEKLGQAGDFNAGSGIRSRVMNWIEDSTTPDDILISEMYRRVGDKVRDVPANLQNLRNLQKELQAEKTRTTTSAHDTALRLIEDMLDLNKFPQGMPYKDLLVKRMEIGGRLKGNIAPEPGTSQPTLKRIYAAMTEDMKFALRRGGGKAGEAAWEEANAAMRQVGDERELLEAIIGKEGQVAPEKIVERLRSMTRSRRGDITRLRLLQRISSPEEWGNLAATLVDDLGRSPKDGSFSVQRFTSDYGKISDSAKALLFGEAREALDDIALVAGRFERLYTSSFNTSKTGTANAVLQLITNPVALIGGGAAMLTDISTGGAALAAGGGLGAGRRLAWMLAKPAVAREASKVFKAYYQAARAASHGAEAIARREAGLSNAIRSYSLVLAQETGGNAAEIQRRLMAEIERIRSASSPKK